MNDINEFRLQIDDIIRTATRFKAVMMEKGLRQARTTCPRCKARDPWAAKQATLHGQISGSRNHFRMSCSNRCGMAMME